MSARSAPRHGSNARWTAIDDLAGALGERPFGRGGAFDMRAPRLVRSAQHAAGRAARWRRRRYAAAKAVAPISARIFPICCPHGTRTSTSQRSSRRCGAISGAPAGRWRHDGDRHAEGVARWRGEPDVSKASRCRSSPANRCSTACAGYASNRDPTLAFRFSCINANACKECMMEIDGETRYACTARLEPREMTVKPLPNKTAGTRSRHRDRPARRAVQINSVTLRCERSEPRRATARGQQHPSRAASRPPQDDGQS